MKDLAENIFLVLFFITMLLLVSGIVGAGICFWIDRVTAIVR